jgi:hypothetical protein
MTTYSRECPQRIKAWMCAALAGALLCLPISASGVEQFAALPNRIPHADFTLTPGKLPFSAADAVHYFSTVLEMSPERDADGTVSFENYHVSHAEDRWTITVRTEGKEVVVVFRVGGDYGLSLAREFFESPLFRREESERFYAMLNDARNSPSERMPRFTVRMQLTQDNDLLTLTLRFTPLDAA